MNKDAIYTQLVSNPPPYRRTEGDPVFHREPTRSRSGHVIALEEGDIPGIQEPSLVSSYEGQIHKILFMFPNWAVSETKYANAYKSVISALRQGTNFVVVHHESAKGTVTQWFEEAEHTVDCVTFVPMPDYISMTDWAEDAFVGVKDAIDDTHYLMEPWEFGRGGDALVADMVPDFDDTRAAQSPLIFQGGNCLVGDDFWFMGADYFVDSVNLLKGGRPPVILPDNPSERQLGDLTRRLFSDYLDKNRRMILIGTEKPIPIRRYVGIRAGGTYYLDIVDGGMGTFQPIFHIDMFITLVGRSENGDFKLLVGSPRMGAQITGDSSAYSYDFVYDRIAHEMSEQGFDVVRNPLVHRGKLTGDVVSVEKLEELSRQSGGDALSEALWELKEAGATATTQVIIREYHHITWNNCLVENHLSEKTVYLPRFGFGDNSDLTVVDDYMKDLWVNQLGFHAHMLGDFNPFAERQGVVHCKKYLARTS